MMLCCFHWWEKRFNQFNGRWYRRCEICGRQEIRSWFRWRTDP